MLSYPIDLASRPRILWAATSNHFSEGKYRYAMGNVWCIHWYNNHGELDINGQIVKLNKGCMTITPPYASVQFDLRKKIGSHGSIQFMLSSSPGSQHRIATKFSNQQAKPILKRITPCAEWYQTDNRRAEVRLWDELANLVTENQFQAESKNLIVEQAKVLIEEHLHEGINVNEIASTLRITSTHLTRLFQQHISMSCSQWLKRRRIQIAQQLLLDQQRKIKDIAATIGMHDLQAFNKFIRNELGHSPRAIRKGMKIKRVRE